MSASKRTPREEIERAFHVSFKLPEQAAELLDNYRDQILAEANPCTCYPHPGDHEEHCPKAQHNEADPRQPAWDAVFAYIRTLPRDAPPASVVERNAVIWRAVNAALTAIGYPDAAREAHPVPTGTL